MPTVDESVYLAAATASVRAEGVNDGYINSTVEWGPFRAAVDAVWPLAVAEGRRQAGLGVDWQTACIGCAGRLNERRAGHEEGYDLALRDHGLMAGDEPVELRSEFSVRWHGTDDDDGIRMDRECIRTAKAANEVGAEMVGQYGIKRWTVWQRQHRDYADGYSWIGPWRKVADA